MQKLAPADNLHLRGRDRHQNSDSFHDMLWATAWRRSWAPSCRRR